MSLFLTPLAAELPARILSLLNENAGPLGLSATASPRTVGDRTQEFLAEKLADLLPDAAKYAASFSRRAMADLAFEDSDGNYYVVDVKTHCRSTKFNMPNLVSVERLTRFYEERCNFFCILIVGYELAGKTWTFSECTFVPVEHLDWQCLTIGALGWGQLQIANANNIIVTPTPRQTWMIELCDALLHFYPREVEKIGARILYFEAAKSRWQSRTEDA